MFVVSVIYTAPLSDIDHHLEAHKSWLVNAYAQGSFLASGRKEPRTGGIILASGQKDQLEALLKTDPFHLAGVARYEITEFVPSMAADSLQNWLTN